MAKYSHQIIPHKAEYDVCLREADEDSDIKDIHGHIEVEYKRTEDRIIFTKTMTLFIYYNAEADDGIEQEQFRSHLASWESTDGKMYQFNLHSSSNIFQEDSYKKGEIQLFQGYAQSTYHEPTQIIFRLPQKECDNFFLPISARTFFINQALSNGIHAPYMSSAKIFDGELDIPISTDISAIEVKSSKGCPAYPTNLLGKRMIQINTTPLGGSVDEDDSCYTTSEIYTETGVALMMTIPFSNFIVTAKLKKVQLYNNQTKQWGNLL